MSDYKFYYPNSDPIEGNNFEERREKFIDFYNKCYYIQFSKYIEDEIDKLLLDKKITDYDIYDIIHILAWKIGKINHKESESANPKKFIYYSDWKRAECNPPYIERYEKSSKSKKEFKINAFWENIKHENFLTECANQINPDEKSLYNLIENLIKNSCDGIGPVYIITLIYFFTKGSYPIYDQFAKKAIYSIRNNIKPGNCVKYKTLPAPELSKDLFGKKYIDEKAQKIIRQIADIIINFKNNIDDIFEYENYQRNRNIDRALWVYGHLFNDASDGKSKNK